MEISKLLGIFAKAKRVFSKTQLSVISSLVDEKVSYDMNEVLTEIRSMRLEMERRFQVLYWVIGLSVAFAIATLTIVITK